jgi:hypothetical protein
MRPDNIDPKLWWLTWIERSDVVAKVFQDSRGNCSVTPLGPYWSPMKSFGAYGSPDDALEDVRRYFLNR